jgi:hypothetical protein
LVKITESEDEEGCFPPMYTPPKEAETILMVRYPPEATTVPESGTTMSGRYVDPAVAYTRRDAAKVPGLTCPDPAS